jgi:hypothetical protein
MSYKSSWVVVLVAIVLAVCLVTDASATDKARPVPVVEVACPPVPCCCEDARVCIQVEISKACYTEAGVRAFVSIFQEAAIKGVENATVRAFNSTKVVPDCVPCKPEDKK